MQGSGFSDALARLMQMNGQGGNKTPNIPGGLQGQGGGELPPEVQFANGTMIQPTQQNGNGLPTGGFGGMMAPPRSPGNFAGIPGNLPQGLQQAFAMQQRSPEQMAAPQFGSPNIPMRNPWMPNIGKPRTGGSGGGSRGMDPRTFQRLR